MKKADVLEIVEKLPDGGDVDVEQLIETLAFCRAVEKGLAAADAGDEIPLEEFERLSEQWLAQTMTLRDQRQSWPARG